MPELGGEGGFCTPLPYKMGSQNAPYKLGLIVNDYCVSAFRKCLSDFRTYFSILSK